MYTMRVEMFLLWEWEKIDFLQFIECDCNLEIVLLYA